MQLEEIICICLFVCVCVWTMAHYMMDRKNSLFFVNNLNFFLYILAVMCLTKYNCVKKEHVITLKTLTIICIFNVYVAS